MNEQELQRWNDATVHGVLDTELLEEKVEFGYSPRGEKTHPGKWLNMELSLRDFLDSLSRHKIGEKDGFCFCQGKLIGGERKSSAVAFQDFLVLDLDTGESLESIHARVRKLNLLACVYTTHSNGKTITEIKRDAVVKWCAAGDDEDLEPGLEQAVGYLLDVKRYNPDVLKGAELLPTEHTAQGVMMRVRHQKMTKARLVLVLARRYSFSEGTTQAEAIKIWKERYYGTARALDTYFDRSCADPARLFFLPRHKKGADFQIDIFAGGLLDLESMPRVTAAELREENAFERAGKEMGGGSEYETESLLWFFGKYGNKFDLADFLLDVDPEGDRGARPSGPGRTHRCPNDDQHSDAGNPDDTGFFCVNALDDEKEQAVANCRHDACSQLDRINFVDLACQAAGIKSATELMKWVPEIVGEDEEDRPAEPPAPPEPTFASPTQAKEAISKLKRGDDDAAIDVARKIGATPIFSPGQIESLLKALKSHSGMGSRSLEAERKRGAESAARESVRTSAYGSSVPLDDDVMRKLASYNKRYAVAKLGSKVRILEEPRKAGEMPALFELDSWKALEANEKIAVTDGDGNTKLEALSKHWMEWPERRTYRGGIVFEPGGCSKDDYNLWRGYPVKPKKGDWSLLRGHIFENICQADEDNFTWLMTWFAQMFQIPGAKLGSAVAIKGRKGTGKSKVLDWVRKAMGQHAIQVSQKNHITGNFNAHQTGVILMVCEEAFWAGDSSSGGVLKNLITSPTMMMEKKGLDAIEVSNYVRLAMISNEDWVIPAGLDDERRFLVLECGCGRQRDTDFFATVDRQMERGGLEAMVHDFTEWKPTGNDWDVLRNPPKTPWLVEQAVESMEAWDRFFLQMINDGGCELPDQPDDITSIDLNEDERTLIPVTDLRWFFENFIKRNHKGAFRLGHGSFLNTQVQKYLLAPEHTVRPRNTSARERCFNTAPLREIRNHLTRKGIRLDEVDEIA